MAEQSDLRIAFLDTASFENGAATRGGVLVTDIESRPYEFRCTSPIRPTSVQRMLYGSTLEEYIFMELIALPLIKAMKEKLALVLVRNPTLLRVRPRLSYPMGLVRRDQKTPIAADAQTEMRPVTISTHRDYPAELAAIQTALASLIQERDLLEPFERIQVALIESHNQHVGESKPGDVRA